jgi:NADH:ubiquinone oxidoreductase subunit F (NADH-binding)
LGTPLRAVVSRCGGLTGSPQAVLVGGYFGAWIAPDADLPLSNEALRPLGAALGARTIVVLPESICGVVETARVAGYMAAQSAGQCGPCVFGLAAVAECLQEIAGCKHAAADALERLPRLEAQIARRGACAHPDGTLGFVRSALDVFSSEIDAHLAGHCTATSHEALLPTPQLAGGWR